jgi:hypothetical protein
MFSAMLKPNKILIVQYIVTGIGIAIVGAMLWFLIAELSHAKRSVITISMVALAGGLIFESLRMAEKSIHVLYISIAAFLLSFMAFLPGKGEGNYIYEVHLNTWPYWFIGFFMATSLAVYYEKAIAPMTEGIILIQSISVLYWIAMRGLMRFDNWFFISFIGVAFILSIFSIVHAVTNLQLSTSVRFIMSLWSSVIMLLFSFDQVNNVLFNPVSAHITYDSNGLFIALQYFLLGVSSIYILINAVLVLGYIPHKGDYRGDVRALTKLHIERFSEEQIYRGHALVCIVITCAWYGLNFYFELLPVGTAIWVGFVLFPLLLRISGLRILRRL